MRSNQPATAPSQAHPVIVLTGGGSGGHITPLLSLAHALKELKPGCRLVYIGLKGDKTKGLEERYRIFDKVYFISSGKFRRYHGRSQLSRLFDLKTLLLNTRDFFKVIAGIFGAYRLLGKISPGVVLSKGGFVVVPVGIAAKMRRVPIVTHDSDALPGLANRIIGRWAVVHATGMPAQHYPYPPKLIRYIGVPSDERIKEVTRSLQDDYKRQIGVQREDMVLVVGGAGLGSRDINNLILAIAPGLLEAIPSLRIFHFSGNTHQKVVEGGYQKTLLGEQLKQVKIIGFSDEFYKYTGAADLVITRAGATTIAELALQRKACLLIPAPFLTGGHQVKNAHILEKMGAAVVVAQDIKPQELLLQLEALLRDEKRRHSLAEKLGQTAHPHAAKKLAEILLDVSVGKKVD